MKKILFVICATMLAFAAEAKDSELKIAYDQIPTKAQSFVSEYYPSAVVKKSTQRFDDGIAVYKVYLKDKTAIEFDMVGAWNIVEAPKKMSVSVEILPAKIKNALASNFADKKIKKVGNDGYVYDITFTDGTKVKINANGVTVE